jgi:hypothetical protein
MARIPLRDEESPERRPFRVCGSGRARKPHAPLLASWFLCRDRGATSL